MKKPTKMALISLAKKMVDSGLYVSTKGTGDFMDEAIKLHKQSDSTVHSNTIRSHERELEEFCRGELLSQNPIKKVQVPGWDNEEENIDEAELDYFYNYYGDIVDNHTIVDKAIEIIQSMMKFNFNQASEDFGKDDDFFGDVKPMVKPPVKTYTMFIEDEDGLRVIRGSYKGLYVREIDHLQWEGCAAGWSRKMLKDNELLGADRKGALTEDDKNVFLDIISGKEV